MRKIIIILLSFLLFSSSNLYAQTKDEIVKILNDASGDHTYLKDFSTKLQPGSESRYSVVLSKNTIYEFSFYQIKNGTFTIKLLGDKKEGEILPMITDLKENIELHQFSIKETGVYHLIVKNTSKENAFTVVLLNFIDKIEDTGNALNETSTDVKSEETIQESEELFFVVEEMPKFKDKENGEFKDYIKNSIIYPQEAIDQNIEGRVFIQFTVSKTGYVQDAKVVRGVHPALNQEALRIVYSSPKWKPGVQNKQAVDVVLTFPVIFKL